MDNEASKIFERILDNSNDIIVEFRNEVFKILGINTQNRQLTEYVQECLERFNFNVAERDFLEQVKSAVTEEIDSNSSKLKNNETVDYEQFTTKLIEKLRQVKLNSISLDDDLLTLSNQITTRFPQINVSRDQLYTHFSSRKEQIVNMFNKYDQDIVETLIKFTPKLSSELQEIERKNKSTSQSQSTSRQTNNDLSVEMFVKRCSQKLSEVNLMFNNGGADKSQIAKGFRQLKKFLDNLSDKDFAQGVLDRYTQLNEVAQGIIYDNIIFENVPMLKEIYEKHESTLVQSQIADLKSNLGKVFDSPISLPSQNQPQFARGGSPREIPIEPVYGAEMPQNFNTRQLREMQEQKTNTPVHTEQEKEEIRQQMQQVQEKITQTLDWAKQQPNTPTFSTLNSSSVPLEYPSDLYINDDKVADYINSKYQGYGSVDKILSVSGYPDSIYEVRFNNGKTHSITITKEEEKRIKQEQVQPQIIEQPQIQNNTEVTMQEQAKKEIIHKIIGSMLDAGEFHNSGLDVSQKLRDIEYAKMRLEMKPLDQLEEILSTYQKQNVQEETMSSGMHR